MITELIASNYRSLGPDLKLEFGRLTALIGPNGSGKSNILDVVTFVRDAALQGLPAAITHRGGIDSVRRRSHGRPYNVKVSLRLQIDGSPARFGFEMTGDKLEEYRVKSEWASVNHGGERCEYRREGDAWEGPEGLAPSMDDQSLALNAVGGDARFKALVDYIKTLTIYSIFPDTLREPQKFNPARPMERHGENWVSVLRELVKEPAKDDLVAGLRKLTGDIEDIKISSAAGYLVAEFKHSAQANKGKRWFDARQQSDGTLRVAGLLTALLQSPSLPVIGIEEPELTIHPGALSMLYEYLKQASERSQVIFSTHSPVILDVLDSSRDTVIVVERREGMTSAHPVRDAQLEPVRRKLMSLGDLYLSGDLQTSSAFPPQDAEA